MNQVRILVAIVFITVVAIIALMLKREPAILVEHSPVEDKGVSGDVPIISSDVISSSEMTELAPCSSNFRRQHISLICETNPPALRNPRWVRMNMINETVPALSVVVFDHERRTLGCIISKVASTAWIAFQVANTLAPKGINPRVAHARNQGILLSDVNGKYANYTKYIIVKHPLQRLVAGYYEGMHERKQYRGTSFEQFMKNLGTGKMVDISSFWTRYNSWCHPCEVHYDYILKIETMATDLPVFNKAVGININASIPLKNTSRFVKNDKNGQNLHKYDRNLTDFYTEQPAVFEKVAALYRPDMEMFGYSWSPDTGSTCAYDSPADKCC